MRKEKEMRETMIAPRLETVRYTPPRKPSTEDLERISESLRYRSAEIAEA